jgi:hypothetical protein
MKTKIQTLLAIVIMIVSLGSCSKYNEGGLVKNADKRLKQSWRLDTYFLDGNDATGTLIIQNYQEEYKENEDYVRSYIDKDGNQFSETGTWAFDSDKENIRIMSVSSLELSDANSTVSTSDYQIVKLKKKELWYSYENGGSLHEFHLIPNE